MTASQRARILAHLLNNGPLTQLEALDLYQCMRLGGRIEELRRAGNEIRTDMVETTTGKRIAQYSLVRVAEQMEMAL